MKHYCLFFFSFFTLLLSAQTQQGYVKTLGRPNKPGVPLSNVTIRMRGVVNAVMLLSCRVSGRMAMNW